MKFAICSMISFIWIGFVSSISFMEAWLKFRAANVTRAIGLGIGQIIFEALNKVEWTFALIIIGCFVFVYKRYVYYQIFFYIALGILLIQTSFILPVLREHVQLILQGHAIPSSPLHFMYIALEVIKVLSLFIFGILSLPYVFDKQPNLPSKQD